MYAAVLSELSRCGGKSTTLCTVGEIVVVLVNTAVFREFEDIIVRSLAYAVYSGDPFALSSRYPGTPRTTATLFFSLRLSRRRRSRTSLCFVWMGVMPTWAGKVNVVAVYDDRDAVDM